ncbi:hypothetical protein AAG570_002454 [Ranatra chinensis]|uniref:Uncharacterized protein n=1 Tax=Ranatra chinensis TaxID=642074 RepID=A0ABD0Y8J8_9HEMI
MASKRQNMFQKNKTQETTENEEEEKALLSEDAPATSKSDHEEAKEKRSKKILKGIKRKISGALLCQGHPGTSEPAYHGEDPEAGVKKRDLRARLKQVLKVCCFACILILLLVVVFVTCVFFMC